MRKRRRKQHKCTICDYVGPSTQMHHIVGRAVAGGNEKFNTAELCCNCHSEVTKGHIIVYGWFLTGGGYTLLWKEE